MRGMENRGELTGVDERMRDERCSAQTRTGMGHLRRPPVVELIPTVD